MANLLAYGEKVIGTTGSVVSWTQTQASGTKIAEIDIDGTTTDVYAPSGGGGSLNYSTTEQVVGTWIDGRPIYQKTIDFGYLPNNTTKNVPHNISDLDRCIKMNGFAVNSAGLNIPLPFISTASAGNGIAFSISTTNITSQAGSNRSGFYAYITLFYTKTSDL